MSHFTEDQLKELEQVFNLSRKVLPVKDGIVTHGQQIWWHHINDPHQVIAAGQHWDNIELFPSIYSIAKPD